MIFGDLGMQVSNTGGSYQDNLAAVGKAPINKQGLRRKTQGLEEIPSRAKQVPWSKKDWITKQIINAGTQGQEVQPRSTQ